MIYSDANKVRSIANKIGDIAQRLRGDMIGDKPITKRAASDLLFDVQVALKQLTDPDDVRDTHYRAIPGTGLMARRMVVDAEA